MRILHARTGELIAFLLPDFRPSLLPPQYIYYLLLTKKCTYSKSCGIALQYCITASYPKVDIVNFMYRRPILCTLYGAVDFLNVLKKYIMYWYVMYYITYQYFCSNNTPPPPQQPFSRTFNRADRQGGVKSHVTIILRHSFLYLECN